MKLEQAADPPQQAARSAAGFLGGEVQLQGRGDHRPDGPVLGRGSPIDPRWIPLKSWLFDHLYLSWLPLRPASALFALTTVAVWAGITGWMHRRRVYLKV